MNNQQTMLNMRNFFRIEQKIPGLINETHVFEQEEPTMEKYFNAISKTRMNPKYPLNMLEYNEYHDEVYVKTMFWEIDLFTRGPQFMKPKWCPNECVIIILNALIDEEQWRKIQDHANDANMHILNPIKINHEEVGPQKIFNLLCSKMFDKKTRACVNMNILFGCLEII